MGVMSHDSFTKLVLAALISFIVVMLGSIHAYDVAKHRKIIGVIESAEFVWEKKGFSWKSFWEIAEKYERRVKIKIKLPNQKEEELLLKGNKDETAFLLGEKYFIKYRREDNKIVGKILLDD